MGCISAHARDVFSLFMKFGGPPSKKKGGGGGVPDPPPGSAPVTSIVWVIDSPVIWEYSYQIQCPSLIERFHLVGGNKQSACGAGN